jgi:hypothetical protein
MEWNLLEGEGSRFLEGATILRESPPRYRETTTGHKIVAVAVPGADDLLPGDLPLAEGTEKMGADPGIRPGTCGGHHEKPFLLPDPKGDRSPAGELLQGKAHEL